MLRQITYLICLTIFLNTLSYAADFPDCNNEPMESFIAVPTNCSKAVFCKGDDSAIIDCDAKKPYFSALDKKCHNSTSVCGNRPFNETNLPTTTPFVLSTISTSIATTTESFTTRNTTLKKEIVTTTLKTTRPDDTTMKEISTTNSPMVPTSTETAAILVQCPNVDNINKPLFLPHPKSCSEYYLCYHGFATLMKCPNRLHFDVARQACNTPEGAKCKVHHIIPREQCRINTLDFYPHPTNCNYYYLCEYGFLMVMQCPFNMYWDYEHRVCAMRPMAKCYNDNSFSFLDFKKQF